MDRKILKQNAKNSFKRKYGESIVVALIMSIFGGIGSGSISFNYTTNTPSAEYSYEYSGGSFEAPFSAIPEEFLYTFLTVFISVLTIFLVAGFLLAPVFIVGGNRFFLKLRKGVHTGIGEVTGNFKDGNYWNVVKIFFFRNMKLFFWMLLFIIPAFVKIYEYLLIDYILAVRPDLDSKSAFNMSKRLMDGHKWDAFVLSLSFWGWNILGACFTFGILNLVYVSPYIYSTFTEFYAFVRADGIRKGIITPMDLPDYEPPMQNGFGMNDGFGFDTQQQGFNGDFQNPYQQPFNAGFQQQPDNNPFGYQQTPYEQPQQTPFWQESNQPVGNVDTMPNEEPVSEDDAKEVEFKPVDEN